MLYFSYECIVNIQLLLRDSQDDAPLNHKQRKKLLKLLNEQEKRGLVYSILESFGYVVNYLNDLKD